jgi:hypothetical protein
MWSPRGVSATGFELAAPRAMSVTGPLPSGVPSLTHSSEP